MYNYRKTIYSQFTNSPTMQRLLYNFNEYIDPTPNINDFFDLVWNVDTAVGWGLDVWGRIVGVSRVLQLPSGDFLGFEAPGGGSASGEPFNQAPFFRGLNLTTNYALLDGPFRTLILAKALFNICDGSIGAINQILINLFGVAGLLPIAGNSYCTDGLNMTMTYTFSAAPDPVQTAIIYQSGVLPRPSGVLATVVHP